jgi:hypothetical protein
MTNSASIQLMPGQRGPPPKRQPVPVQTTFPLPSFNDSLKEIERAIAEIMELDRAMTSLETQINRQTDRLGDPSTDEWDRIAIQESIDALTFDNATNAGNLLMSVTAINYHGGQLIDGWRDAALDNIGLRFSQVDRLFTRVQQEWPGVAKHPVWQRLHGSAVPF